MKKVFTWTLVLIQLSQFVFGTVEFDSVQEMKIQKDWPDPFLKQDGSRIRTKEDWLQQRDYWKAWLQHYQYGTMPPKPKDFELTHIETREVFGGSAIEERYQVTLTRNGKTAHMEFDFIRPNSPGKKAVIIQNNWNIFRGLRNNTDKTEWIAAKHAVNRGFILCLFDRNQFADDRIEDRPTGAQLLYPEYTWGHIATWAWGNSVIIDALNRLGKIDMEKIVVSGHSRAGKAALCAGIYDERIAVTAPNSSGNGGTGSYRVYKDGIVTGGIGPIEKSDFPHWFTNRYHEFAGKEKAILAEAHIRKALIAPRALINTCGKGDHITNPYGTEVSYRIANDVYNWLGAKDQQGINWRRGGHEQKEIDWIAMMDFAQLKLFGKATSRSFNKLNFPNADASHPTWEVPTLQTKPVIHSNNLDLKTLKLYDGISQDFNFSAMDEDGEIQKLRVFINDILKAETSSNELTVSNILDGLGVGDHYLRISSMDNDGQWSFLHETLTIHPRKIMDYSSLNLNDQWQRVQFNHPILNPVVIMGPMTFNGSDAAIVEIRNCNEKGFEARIREWEYLDGTHSYEQVPYWVVESGKHIVNGIQIEAMTLEASDQNNWYAMENNYNTSPVVLTSFVAGKPSIPIKSRVTVVGTKGFGVTLETEEQSNTLLSGHVHALIVQRAIKTNDLFSTGLTKRKYNEKWNYFSFHQNKQNPLIFAETQSYIGKNPFSLRMDLNSWDGKGLNIHLQEEQSADNEVLHYPESVGWVMLLP